MFHADFFSETFQKKYREYFDVVISRGFIEDVGNIDIEDVVEKHVNVLAKDGYLFVVIPNFRGINYLGLWLFSRELLTEINFDIMKKEKLPYFFDKKNISTLYCDYYGTSNCGDRFSYRQDFVMRLVSTACNTIQRILNIIFRLLLKEKGRESSFFSPYMIFVGAKKG